MGLQVPRAVAGAGGHVAQFDGVGVSADLRRRQARVRRHQAGGDHRAAGVDDLGAGGDFHVRADGDDPAVTDQHSSRGDLAGRAHGIDVAADDGDGLGRGRVGDGQGAEGGRRHEGGLEDGAAHQRVPSLGWPSRKSDLGL